MAATVRLGQSGENAPWITFDQIENTGRSRLEEAGYAMIRAPLSDLRPALVRLKELDAAVQPIVIMEPGDREKIENILRFTPGAGEVWVVSESESTEEDLLRRATEVTRKRRSFRKTRSKLQMGLASIQLNSAERVHVSDAFLAALLHVVPDPILSIDEADRVISANPAAERVLGEREAEMIERPLAEVLGATAGDVERILARDTASQKELRFERSDGSSRTGEITIAPVASSLLDIRCVLLRDVTEERRFRAILEDQAAELEEQAVEYEMVNQTLHERTEELERAMESRSRFYAAMSHELRTPLNAIIGYNELLLEGVLGDVPEQFRQPLTRAQRAASHLLELVNDVLDLAKIDAGRIELDLMEVPFPQVLRDLMDTVRPLAEQNGSELRIQGPDEVHTVRSDPRRVRQVALNLLSNAIKFGAGKPVEIRWRPLDGGGIELAISDQGIGIAEDQLQEIFEEFVQLGSSDGGSGLGLAISYKLAEALGGRLEVASDPGAGSTFKLILPADLD